MLVEGFESEIEVDVNVRHGLEALGWALMTFAEEWKRLVLR